MNPKIEARPCQGSSLSRERFIILSPPPVSTASHVNRGAWREGQSGQMTRGLIQTLEVLSGNPHDALSSPQPLGKLSEIKPSICNATGPQLSEGKPLHTLPPGPLPFRSPGQCSQHCLFQQSHKPGLRSPQVPTAEGELRPRRPESDGVQRGERKCS